MQNLLVGGYGRGKEAHADLVLRRTERIRHKKQQQENYSAEPERGL